MTEAGRIVKRLVDIGVSATLLFALTPVLFAIAIAVKFDSPGPVLFRQNRLGRHGRIFEILKFRTMCHGASVVIGDDHTVVNRADDDRITRVGRWLRQTSLDELPQLINVLAGEMSLVGPRPDLPEAFDMYRGDEVRKLDVRPGITGLSQVSGRNLLDAHAKWELDTRYAQKVVLATDLRIIARTVLNVVQLEGIYRKEAEK
jgi:lipopolysaccharide/colanic/teichoic acid biosynthesis glycosyltransferase